MRVELGLGPRAHVGKQVVASAAQLQLSMIHHIYHSKNPRIYQRPLSEGSGYSKAHHSQSWCFSGWNLPRITINVAACSFRSCGAVNLNKFDEN